MDDNLEEFSGWFNDKGEYVSTVTEINEVNIQPVGAWQVAPDRIGNLLRWAVAYYNDHYYEEWEPIQNRKDGTLSLKIDFDDLINLNGEP